MKFANARSLFVALILATGLFAGSCKNKKEEAKTVEPTTVNTPAADPVEISTDDALQTGLKDATKDYPGVNATVSNGEITLTGEIQRSRLPNLMQSLNSLRPKKINNNLTIK